MRFVGGHWATLVAVLLLVTAPTKCSALEASRTMGFSSALSDDGCNFTGEIVLSHPMSIGVKDRYYAICDAMQKSYELMVAFINEERCGVRVHNATDRRRLVLQTFGDGSDAAISLKIAKYIVQDEATDFFLGGYGALTQEYAGIAQNQSKLLLLAGGGGSTTTTSVEEDNWVFGGHLDDNSQTYQKTLQLLWGKGARSLAIVRQQDDDATSVECANLTPLALGLGYDLVTMYEFRNASTAPGLMVDLSESNDPPDVVLMCVEQDTVLFLLMEELQSLGYSPNAIVTARPNSANPAIAMDPVLQDFLIVPTSWFAPNDDSQQHPADVVQDAVTGWSAQDFDPLFKSYAFRNSSYLGASAASVVSVLVQAIEAAQSIDQGRVRAVLQTQSFPTLLGHLSLDPQNGPPVIPIVVQQYQKGVPRVVNATSIVYPAPTWTQRQCRMGGPRNFSGHCSGDRSCQRDGTCRCAVYEADTHYSWGVGGNATCLQIVQEDYSWTHPAFEIAGLVLLGLQGIMSLSSIVWTLVLWLRHGNPIVKASQPTLLILMSVGTLLMAASVVPMMVQTEYRHLQDSVTGEIFSDQPNPYVWQADAACMLAPWLWGLGFALTLASLVAKLLRAQRLLDNARRHVYSMPTNRVTATTTEKPRGRAIMSLTVVGTTGGIMVALLLAWQWTSPWTWQRTVAETNAEGRATVSQGTCDSEHGWSFFIGMLSCQLACLWCALFLCWRTRSIPSRLNLNETTFTFACLFFMLEALIIALPMLFLFQTDPDMLYVIRLVLLFTQTCLPTVLIFGPKVAKIHFDDISTFQYVKNRVSGEWVWKPKAHISSNQSAFSLRPQSLPSVIDHGDAAGTHVVSRMSEISNPSVMSSVVNPASPTRRSSRGKVYPNVASLKHPLSPMEHIPEDRDDGDDCDESSFTDEERFHNQPATSAEEYPGDEEYPGISIKDIRTVNSAERPISSNTLDRSSATAGSVGVRKVFAGSFVGSVGSFMGSSNNPSKATALAGLGSGSEVRGREDVWKRDGGHGYVEKYF